MPKNPDESVETQIRQDKCWNNAVKSWASTLDEI